VQLLNKLRPQLVLRHAVHMLAAAPAPPTSVPRDQHWSARGGQRGPLRPVRPRSHWMRMYAYIREREREGEKEEDMAHLQELFVSDWSLEGEA
jgi:hypothetical protein